MQKEDKWTSMAGFSSARIVGNCVIFSYCEQVVRGTFDISLFCTVTGRFGKLCFSLKALNQVNLLSIKKCVNLDDSIRRNF